MCTKRRYPSRATARRALRTLRGQRQRTHAPRVERGIYWCRARHAWHLTSQQEWRRTAALQEAARA